MFPSNTGKLIVTFLSKSISFVSAIPPSCLKKWKKIIANRHYFVKWLMLTVGFHLHSGSLCCILIFINKNFWSIFCAHSTWLIPDISNPPDNPKSYPHSLSYTQKMVMIFVFKLQNLFTIQLVANLRWLAIIIEIRESEKLGPKEGMLSPRGQIGI